MEGGQVVVYNLAIGVIFTCLTAQKGPPSLHSAAIPFLLSPARYLFFALYKQDRKLLFRPSLGPPINDVTHCRGKGDVQNVLIGCIMGQRQWEGVQKCKIFVLHHLWMVSSIAAPVARVIYHIFHLRTDFL